jgi:hypothetical protein
LLFSRADVLLANDLDTLLANYIASKIKSAALVYDSHEYYTEVPELVSRPKVQAVWKRIESFIFPRLKYVYTVNESIAEIYRAMYKVPVQVIRNLPTNQHLEKTKSRIDLGLPVEKKVIILQGAGINVDRGGEELIEAMAYIHEDCVLLIVGAGDVLEQQIDLDTVTGILRLGTFGSYTSSVFKNRVDFNPVIGNLSEIEIRIKDKYYFDIADINCENSFIVEIRTIERQTKRQTTLDRPSVFRPQ